MAQCVTFAVARIRIGNRQNFAYFSLWHPKYGRQGIQKAYTGPRTGIYLLTKFGCDRSIVVGCRSRNDRQTDKQNGMTIRLTLCERDATVHHTIIIVIDTIASYSCNHVSSATVSFPQSVRVSGSRICHCGRETRSLDGAPGFRGRASPHHCSHCARQLRPTTMCYFQGRGWTRDPGIRPHDLRNLQKSSEKVLK